MRYLFLSLVSWFLQIAGWLALLSLFIIAYFVWDSFGAVDWDSVQKTPMLLIENEAYRKYTILFLSCLFGGFLFLGVGDLLKIFFNIERNGRETNLYLRRTGQPTNLGSITTR